MPSAWITHVKKYAAENNVSYKEALSKASASYKKGSGVCDSQSEEPTPPPQENYRPRQRTLTASNRNPPRRENNNNNPGENRPVRLQRGLDIDEDITEERSSQLISGNQESSSQNFNNLNQPSSSRRNSLEYSGNGKKKRGKGKKNKNSYASRK